MVHLVEAREDDGDDDCASCCFASECVLLSSFSPRMHYHELMNELARGVEADRQGRGKETMKRQQQDDDPNGEWEYWYIS
jgi:hypothetical protein